MLTHSSEKEMKQFLLGRLPRHRRERLGDHLIVCAKCIDHAEALAMILQFLRLATGGPEKE